MATEEDTGSGDEIVGDEHSLATRAIDTVLRLGVDGAGPFKSAQEVADEHLRQHGDVEVAIERLIRTHTRLVAATGFATGLGGILTLPVTIPTDVTSFYALSTRCVAGIAHLRRHDLSSDEVRSVVLLSLIGSGGVTMAADLGAELGTKAAFAALRRLPGRVLIDINKKVGFRLFTKAGTTGVINVSRFVPLVGGGVGSAIDVSGMRTAARYAKRNFPPMSAAIPLPE